MLRTTISITRPDTSVPFFYDVSEFINSSEYAQLIADAISNNIILAESNQLSNGDLTFTRVVDWANQEAKDLFMQNFTLAHAEFWSDRQEYCQLAQHVLEISNTEM